MNINHPVLLTERVYRRVAEAALGGRAIGLETGGSLLALEAGSVTVITEALWPGPQAQRAWSSIKTDADFQNDEMADSTRRDPRLGYIGDWHIHPMWLPELSWTDRRTAQEILNDDAEHRDHLLLLLGSVRPDGGAWVGCFRATRGQLAMAAVEAVPFEVVRDDDPRIAAIPRTQPRESVMNTIQKLLSNSDNFTAWDAGVLVVPPWALQAPVGTPLYGHRTGSDDDPRIVVLASTPHPGLEAVGVVAEATSQASEDQVAFVAGDRPTARLSRGQLSVVINDPARYRARLAGLPGVERLAGRVVVIAGLGSVGSALGAALVRLGVRVIGCDPDVLSIENLVRWGLTLPIGTTIGRRKASVWADFLRATVPGARVEGHAIDITRCGARFDDLISRERPDLIVAATDTRSSRLAVNAAAAKHGVPSLFVALSDGAASVRVELVEDARKGPCHLCALVAEDGMAPTQADTRRLPYAVEDPAAADEVDDQAAVAALPVDVSLATALATRIALQAISGQDWRPFFEHGAQHGNILVMSLRPDWWIFDEPYERLIYSVFPIPECPVCGTQERS